MMSRTHSALAILVLLVSCGLAWGQFSTSTNTSTSTSSSTSSRTTSDEKVTTSYDKVTVVRETQVREVQVQLKERKAKPVYVAAIFVKNRAARISDDKVLVVQDFMNGHLNGRGFRVISREDVINKVADFATEGPNRGDKRLAGEKLDQLLSNNTSALRLAENMGADYVLNVSVTQYGRDAVRYKAQGIEQTTVDHKLKLTYTLLDTTIGSALTSGIATATFTERFLPGTEIVRENTVDDLLEAAAQDLANMMTAASRTDMIPGPETIAAAKKEVPFTIYCAVADLTVPEVIKNASGQWVVTSNSLRVQPLAFTVDLDGVTIGSTNVPVDQDGRVLDAPNFMARPGLHKIRIHRKLFTDWETTINIREGLRLTVAMVMTKEGMDQFLGLGKEFNEWKTNQALTELQIKMYETYLAKLRECDLSIPAPGRGGMPGAGVGPGRPGSNADVEVNVKVRGTEERRVPQTTVEKTRVQTVEKEKTEVRDAVRGNQPADSNAAKKSGGTEPLVDPDLLPKKAN